MLSSEDHVRSTKSIQQYLKSPKDAIDRLASDGVYRMEPRNVVSPPELKSTSVVAASV